MYLNIVNGVDAEVLGVEAGDYDNLLSMRV
jgi:hypothetical protein